MGFDREIDPNTVENPEGPVERNLTPEETVAKLEKFEKKLSVLGNLSLITDEAALKGEGSQYDLGTVFDIKSDGKQLEASIQELGLEGYTFDPAGESNPLGLGADIYDRIGSKGQIRAFNLATAVSNYNMALEVNPLIEELTGRSDIAPVGARVSDLKTNKKVDDWLVNNAGVSSSAPEYQRAVDNLNPSTRAIALANSKLGKRFTERPDLKQEFIENPRAFVLKYADDQNALYGPPKKPSDIKSNTKIAAGVNTEDLTSSILNQDPDGVQRALGKNNITPAQEARIATQLADPNTAGRYTSPERVDYIAGVLSSLDPDSFLFKAFVGSDGAGLRSFITSGKLDFTQETLDMRRAELAERHNTAYRTWKQRQEANEKPKEFAFVGGWTGNETEELYTIDRYTKDRIFGSVIHREAPNRRAATLFNSIIKTGRDRGYLMQNEQATIDSIQDFRIGQAKTAIQLDQDKNRSMLDNVLITFGFKTVEGRTIFEINPNLLFFTSDNKPITTKDQLLAMSKNDMKFMKAKTRGNREDVSLNSVKEKLGNNIVYDVAYDSLPFAKKEKTNGGQ